MKASKAEQRALITLLNRIYADIRDIEEPWGIRAGNGDFRPRIEYFHDAVRALTESSEESYGGHPRLSVEMLAYDIEMLRYIQSDPLPKTGKNRMLSPETDVLDPPPRPHADKTGLKPDASVRYRLADGYKNYAVVFAALLSDIAERNYISCMADAEAEKQEWAELIETLSAKTSPMKDTLDIEDMINDVPAQETANMLQTALKSGTLKKRMAAKDARKALKEMMQALDKKIRSIEKAHLTYATGQLALYENSRDVVKGMAVRGLNIVGDFVESAVQDARRGDRGN